MFWFFFGARIHQPVRSFQTRIMQLEYSMISFLGSKKVLSSFWSKDFEYILQTKSPWKDVFRYSKCFPGFSDERQMLSNLLLGLKWPNWSGKQCLHNAQLCRRCWLYHLMLFAWRVKQNFRITYPHWQCFLFFQNFVRMKPAAHLTPLPFQHCKNAHQTVAHARVRRRRGLEHPFAPRRVQGPCESRAAAAGPRCRHRREEQLQVDASWLCSGEGDLESGPCAAAERQSCWSHGQGEGAEDLLVQ